MAVKKLTEGPHVRRFTWSERIGVNIMTAISCQEEGKFTSYCLRHLCQNLAMLPKSIREGKDAPAIRKPSPETSLLLGFTSASSQHVPGQLLG